MWIINIIHYIILDTGAQIKVLVQNTSVDLDLMGSPDTPIDELVDYWKWLEENYGIDISKVIAEHEERRL